MTGPTAATSGHQETCDEYRPWQHSIENANPFHLHCHLFKIAVATSTRDSDFFGRESDTLTEAGQTRALRSPVSASEPARYRCCSYLGGTAPNRRLRFAIMERIRVIVSAGDNLPGLAAGA
jgi:hypothetical protein